MKYEAVARQLRLNTWEFKSQDGHGDIEHVIFVGPKAEKQARAYLKWRNRLKQAQGGDNAAL